MADNDSGNRPRSAWDINDYTAQFDPVSLGFYVDGAELLETNTDGEPIWPPPGIPAWILAHELSHAMHACATPLGLQDLLFQFAWESQAIVIVNRVFDLIGPTAEVPLNIRAFQAQTNDSQLGERLAMLQEFDKAMNYRRGGIAVDPDHLPAEIHGSVLHRAGPDGQWIALGSRAMYEGYAAAIEVMRKEQELGPLHDDEYPPEDPYIQALSLFNALRPRENGPRGSLLEFTCVMDTIFLAGADVSSSDLYGYSNPGHTYNLLMDTLSNNHTIELRGYCVGDFAEFQNQLLQAIGHPTPDVAEITLNTLRAVPRIFDEIWEMSRLGPQTLRAHRETVQKLLMIRLGYPRGANPAPLFLTRPIDALWDLVDQFPGLTFGKDHFLTAADALEEEDRPPTGRPAYTMYVRQAQAHMRHVLRQLLSESRPCSSRGSCLLPVRPACSGLTASLTPEASRCSRETALMYVLRPGRDIFQDIDRLPPPVQE